MLFGGGLRSPSAFLVIDSNLTFTFWALWRIDAGTPSRMSRNEVDTHLQSGHNTERNPRNAILIRVHLGSNDHRGPRQ